MTAFLFISFIAGILTVISPCVLPLLPIIVGGSIAGGKSLRRALVVTSALGVSVFLFTFLLKVSTVFVIVPQGVWNWISGLILFVVGISFLFPTLWDRIPLINALYRRSNKILGSGYQKQNIWGDVVVGAALGPVFSSCSPTYFVVLASVLPVSLSAGVIDILAYTLGMCGFLLIISVIGQNIVNRLGIVADPNGWFRKVIGALFILVALIIVTGIQNIIEAPLYNIFDETKVEQHFLSGNAIPSPTPNGVAQTVGTTSTNFLSLSEKAMIYEKAPELVSPDGYINTGGQPITLSQYVGKDVVLVDFWDYSCINCQRTIPYLNAWYQKYKDQGLVIIGVHTPEFAFEHQLSNIQSAVNQFGIKYPVVLDNEYKTWNAFNNEYWPNEYLIDIDGYIVHNQAGEGNYDETEKAIQQALAERAARLGSNQVVATSTVAIPTTDLSAIQSPETYFGSDRNEYLGNGTPGEQGVQNFALPNNPQLNTLYLGGSWNIFPQYAEAGASSSVVFEYNAHDIYMVAANNGGSVKIKVLLDGQPVGNFAGADVDPKTSEAIINGDRLYKLVHNPTPGVHTIEIQIESGTLDAYTFTFG